MRRLHARLRSPPRVRQPRRPPRIPPGLPTWTTTFRSNMRVRPGRVRAAAAIVAAFAALPLWPGVCPLSNAMFSAISPADLGVRDGRLAPCPETPNCVSSQAQGKHYVAPLAFADAPDAALAR
ncbi:MAG: DUF1499 domain-containing protein, partial [Burkholderiales bacterium]